VTLLPSVGVVLDGVTVVVVVDGLIEIAVAGVVLVLKFVSPL